MIARTWRGATAAEDADEYLRYLEKTGFSEYRQAEGNRGVVCLQRPTGDRTEFLVLSFWSSEAAAHAFAGGETSRAVFYPEDDRFLIDKDEFVRHHSVAHIDLHAI